MDSDEEADGCEAEDQAGAAEADEGEGKAVVGQDGGGHGDVDDGGDDDDTGEAEGDAALEDVFRLERDSHSADGNDDVADDHAEGGGQAEFLADDGKDEVDVGEGEGSEFLDAVAEAHAPWAAVAEGEEGAPLLHAAIELMDGVFEIHPSLDATPAVGVVADEMVCAGHRKDGGGEHVEQAGADAEHDCAGGDGEGEGGADIRFRSDEAEGDGDDDARDDEAAPEGMDFGLPAREP